MFEKLQTSLITSNLRKFLMENNLISSNQSGFKPGDFSINQLFSLTHKIYKSFDDRIEVRGVFLDIGKMFDAVWPKSIIF